MTAVHVLWKLVSSGCTDFIFVGIVISTAWQEQFETSLQIWHLVSVISQRPKEPHICIASLSHSRIN